MCSQICVLLVHALMLCGFPGFICPVIFKHWWLTLTGHHCRTVVLFSVIFIWMKCVCVYAFCCSALVIVLDFKTVSGQLGLQWAWWLCRCLTCWTTNCVFECWRTTSSRCRWWDCEKNLWTAWKTSYSSSSMATTSGRPRSHHSGSLLLFLSFKPQGSPNVGWEDRVRSHFPTPAYTVVRTGAVSSATLAAALCHGGFQ